MKADMRVEEEMRRVHPSVSPGVSPSAVPTVGPSNLPSAEPSEMRSKTPSREPSSAPTSRPSGSPSMSASEEPIGGPSVSQSAVPSETHSKSSSTSEISSDDTTAYNSISGGSDEITMIPKLLDSKLEKYDSDGALRSTIIKVGNDWFRKRQENLLTPSRTKRLDEETIDEEKKNALDLLDAISRSGSLSLATSELHVIIGVTHSLDESAISFFFLTLSRR